MDHQSYGTLFQAKNSSVSQVMMASVWLCSVLMEAAFLPLAARLERLTAGERQVLDAAAVVGQLFYAGAVVELTALEPQAVAGHLRSLARKEMVRSERSDIPGEDGFAFTHILVRDSAYQALSKLRRADLHERLARWLEV